MTEKISRRGWESVWQKWQKIRTKTFNKESFNNRDGFSDLRVADPCGYCAEFKTRDYSFDNKCCVECPMFKQNVCSNFDTPGNNALFWQYVVEMQKHKPDLEKALEIVDKIISAIEADEPSKEEL
ncbi:hypothetical protein ACFLZC_00100 [Patescibacteria group bacterium]